MARLLKLLSAARILLWPAYWLSGFSRRDNSLWVFTSGDGRRFTDNSKWLFLSCTPESGIRAVWLTRSRALAREMREQGFVAHYSNGPWGIHCALRASTYIFDGTAGAFNLWFSRGARLVNLWHGVPLKRIEADLPKTSRYYRHFPPWSPRGLLQRIFQPYNTIPHDYIVATSRRIGAILAGAFRMPPERVLVTGYPRNDALLRDNLPVDHLNSLGIGLGAFQRVFGYFPTFRELLAPVNEPRWDWPYLDAALRRLNVLLVIKLHPTDRRGIHTEGLTNIRVLPANCDAYPLLRRLDALVTDYSSIFIDYLLLDRPVVFFPYDLARYRDDERGFYFDYDTVTPGPKVETFEAFVTTLCDLAAHYEEHKARWQQQRASVIALCHEYRDGDSADRLIAALRQCPPDTHPQARLPGAASGT